MFNYYISLWRWAWSEENLSKRLARIAMLGYSSLSLVAAVSFLIVYTVSKVELG